MTQMRKFEQEAIAKEILDTINASNSKEQQAMEKNSKELKNIPGVLEVSTGKVLRSARVIVDDTFDVSIIIKFASKEYLKDYLVHPIHIKIANEVIKPLANKITVYDTIIQE